MQTDTLKGRAKEATLAYLEGKGYDILDEDFFGDGEALDIVAEDDGTLVFVGVVAKEPGDGEVAGIESRKGETQRLAGKWLAEHDYIDVPLRFDQVSILLGAEGLAMLRLSRNIVI